MSDWVWWIWLASAVLLIICTNGIILAIDRLTRAVEKAGRAEDGVRYA